MHRTHVHKLQCTPPQPHTSLAAHPGAPPAPSQPQPPALPWSPPNLQVAASEVTWSVSLPGLARAAATLLQHGWPASFLVVYDELWQLVHEASAPCEATTGNAVNMDVLAW